MTADLEFEILGIPEASGALAYHADTDVAGLNPGTAELVLRVITNAHTVAPQRLCKFLQVEHGRLIGYPALDFQSTQHQFDSL